MSSATAVATAAAVSADSITSTKDLQPSSISMSEGGAKDPLAEIMTYGKEHGWLKEDKGKLPGAVAVAAQGNASEAASAATGSQGLLEAVMEAKRWGGLPPAQGECTALQRSKHGKSGSALLAGEDTFEGMLHCASEACRAAEEKLLSDGLTCCEDWLSLRDTFFTSGSLFAVAGYPDAAAKCFLHATFINSAFKGGAEDEARMTLTQCVDNLKTLHPNLAVEALLQLATSYERSGTDSRYECNRKGGFPPLFWQAARCRKEAAELLDKRLGNHTAAAPLYEAAIETYKRAGGERPFRPRTNTILQEEPEVTVPTSATSRKFLDMYKSFISVMQDRLGVIYSELGEYEKAEMIFVEKAQCTPCGLPATKYYLYATLCVLVRGFGDEDSYFNSLHYTKKSFDQYQEMDKGFQKGKENQLVRNILHAFDSNSLNSFDIALNTYISYATTQSSPAFDVLTARCRQNLLDHLERYA